MEGLEVVVRGNECSEAVETLSRAPEVVESERGETFPAFAQVEVVRNGASEARTTGGSVRYVKILRVGQEMKQGSQMCGCTCKLGKLESSSETRRSLGFFVVP